MTEPDLVDPFADLTARIEALELAFLDLAASSPRAKEIARRLETTALSHEANPTVHWRFAHRLRTLAERLRGEF